MDNKSILKVIYDKNKILRLIQSLFGLLIVSIAYNLFNVKCNLVYGVSGIGIMLNSMYGLDTSLVVLIFNVVLLIVSFIFLGKESTENTILGSLLYPVFIKITEPLTLIELGNLENILVTFCGAVLTGIGLGIVFKSGYTTGGTDVINKMATKYGKMSTGKAMYFSDFSIILLSLFVFNFSTFIYSLISMYIISFVVDKVILGISQSKAFYIITEHETDVKRFITQNLSHGVTVLEARGGYTGDMKKVIMCIVPTKEYYLFREGIELLDKDAFFIVTDAYEVSGGV